MKIKLHHILITFSSIVFFPAGTGTTYAQDAAGAPSFEAYDTYLYSGEKEKVVLSPGETDPVVNTSKPQTHSAKDSIASTRLPVHRNLKNSTEASKQINKSKDEDDSILSFNFLYYIIQKYKLQDIVD